MGKRKDTKHAIDVFVGQQLRAARKARGWSQQQLGREIHEPITFQQVQKYERSINRVSASMLYEFATVLNVPVSYFFPVDKPCEPLLNRQEATMINDFRSMPEECRKALGKLISVMRLS